jgi:hypothetical protein
MATITPLKTAPAPPVRIWHFMDRANIRATAQVSGHGRQGSARHGIVTP